MHKSYTLLMVHLVLPVVREDHFLKSCGGAVIWRSHCDRQPSQASILMVIGRHQSVSLGSHVSVPCLAGYILVMGHI